MNEDEGDFCCTPVGFSQPSFLSQSQEIVPVHRFVGLLVPADE